MGRGIDRRRQTRGMWTGFEIQRTISNGEDRGQYSDAVLNELESQNDGQVEGIMGKVRQLKDVSLRFGYPSCRGLG